MVVRVTATALFFDKPQTVYLLSNTMTANVIGEKTILLATTGIDNGANPDGVVGASRVHGKELLGGGLVHDVGGR